jgi:hypothetical protein
MDSSPEAPEFFSLEDNFARYTPEGDVSLESAVEMISGVIAHARANDIPGVLIDVRRLHGFPHPSVVDRFWFVREWATRSGGRVVLAMVQRPEMIDSDHIGVTMASNAGLTANVFDNEDDARSWLIANI